MVWNASSHPRVRRQTSRLQEPRGVPAEVTPEDLVVDELDGAVGVIAPDGPVPGRVLVGTGVGAGIGPGGAVVDNAADTSTLEGALLFSRRGWRLDSREPRGSGPEDMFVPTT